MAESTFGNIDTPEDRLATFFRQMDLVRKAGKEWWAELQILQIEDGMWADKKIAELTQALEMVRDADEDCKKDGLPTMPWMPRAAIDKALDRAKLPADPDGTTFSSFKQARAEARQK